MEAWNQKHVVSSRLWLQRKTHSQQRDIKRCGGRYGARFDHRECPSHGARV